MNLKTRIAATGTAVALVLTVAACSGSTDETTTPAAETSSAASESTGAVDAARNAADTEFAQMMIVHHEGAVEMADLAVEQAQSEEVRTLAGNISAAQGPEIEEMTSWLQGWGEETSPAMGGMDHGSTDMDGLDQAGAMDELASLSGTEFDRRFLELMVAHHEGAVAMAEIELTDGENPQALELAQTIIDAQRVEIAEMEQMLEAL